MSQKSNNSNSLKCNKFRPVCLNVENKEISKCGAENTPPIEILDYILTEMKENNKEIKSDYINPIDDTGNCYSTDNAWLVIIKNIEKKLAGITKEELQQLFKQLRDNKKKNNNNINELTISNINLLEFFKKIIDVADKKWVESKTTNTNGQIREKILKKYKEFVYGPGFKAMSDSLDKTANNENVEIFKSNNQTQQITEEQFKKYKDIIKNLFVYTLPIMNSDSDLSNVFGRDNIDKIDKDFHAINDMLKLFSSTSVAGGSRSNKKTKKNSGKREKTHTKKNNYNMRGGVIPLFVALGFLLVVFFASNIIGDIVKCNKMLDSKNKYIDLSKCNKNKIVKFIESINEKQIESLTIKKKIGQKEAKALATALKGNTTITQLIIDKNKIGVEGAEALAKALVNNATLIKNNNNSNYIKFVSTEKFNKTLKILAIRRNKIGDAGAIALAEALKFNTTLTELYIDDNEIGDEGAQELAKALEGNTTLTTLYISSNQFGDAGAIALAEALKTNTTLTTLDISFNKIGDAGVIALAKELKINTTLTKLNVSYNTKVSYYGYVPLLEKNIRKNLQIYTYY